MPNLKLHPDVWDKPATPEDVKAMKKELSKWSVGFIVCGIIFIIFCIIVGLTSEFNVVIHFS